MKNMVKVKTTMNGAGGGLGRIEKAAVAAKTKTGAKNK